jgi:hypothetical protein
VKFGAFCAVLVIAGVVVELLVPGRPQYHAGWYNVVIAAAMVTLALRIRGLFSAFVSPQARAGAMLGAFGVGIIGFSGVASGLLGPDAQIVVGAPGQSVPVGDLGGAVQFPLRDAPSSAELVRGGRIVPIGARRMIGSFLLYSIPRSVVFVSVSDARDAHLTITQPTGSAFLSPVLLMQHRQNIAGLDLPFDEFAVPAAHRIVHAVLFSAEQAAQLHQIGGVPSPAVLFDVEDETGASVPNGIGIARDGATAVVAGLRIRPQVITYPAVGIVSIPNLTAVAVGLLALAAGLVIVYRPPFRQRSK